MQFTLCTLDRPVITTHRPLFRCRFEPPLEILRARNTKSDSIVASVSSTAAVHNVD